MNKVVNVNISGKAFTIDEDAYDELNRYLKRLQKHFSHSLGADEIMYDIENRIGELLTETSDKGIIISKGKIEEVMAVMGTPKDFEESDTSTHHTTHRRKENKVDSQNTSKSSRRLFRDPDDKVLGGVASGLAAYFGTRPILIRILFLLMFFGFGTGLLLYLLLWAFIPIAITRSDFLSMQGEDINIKNISKMVEDGFKEIKGTIEDLGKDIKEKVM